MRKLFTYLSLVLLGVASNAQEYSNDVVLLSQDGNTITVQATASAAKKKEARELAAKSALHTLFHEGIEGVKDGNPMFVKEKETIEYRFFNSEKYLDFFADEAQEISNKKINQQERVTVNVTITLPRLIKYLNDNQVTLHPSWTAGSKKATPLTALNPTIVVVPYVKGSDGNFADMKTLIDCSDYTRQLIKNVTAEFSKKGYKTYDFVAWMQDVNNQNMMLDGTLTDLDTKIVQALPGDIMITVDGTVNFNERGHGSCTISIDALEKQTRGNLSTASISSGEYTISDSLALADIALKKVKSDFFKSLSDNFDKMVQEGREVVLEFAISDNIDDWDFDQETSAGDSFKDIMEEWIREKAYNDSYRMNNHTSKYIYATINVPLWNIEKNKAYTLYDFNKELNSFLKKQLNNDGYQAAITAMGQKLKIVIQ